MNDTLKKNLTALLKKNRVVFWYDGRCEFESDFNEFEADSVIKMELTGENDFRVKYEILKVHPEAKFLLYAKFDEPPYEDNWLLDIQLSNDVFRTDACAVYLAEYSLPDSCFETVRKHERFFRAEKRGTELRKINGYGASPQELEHAMIAVCAGMETYRCHELAVKLIAEEFQGGRKKIIEALESCNLSGDVWEEFAEAYGYSGSSIRDFTVYLYEGSYNRAFSLDDSVSGEARMVMSSLKNTLRANELSAVAGYAYDQLGIGMKLSEKPYQEFLEFDDYPSIDGFIIPPLVSGAIAGTVGSREIQDVISRRRDGKWYGSFSSAYEGLLNGIRVIEKIRTFDYEMTSYNQAVLNYSSTWYEVDYCYRQFCMAMQNGGIDYLSELKNLVDNKYLNSFLRPLNEEWTKQAVNLLRKGWSNPLMCIREKFYPYYVKKILDEKRTAVVIISDALRYEVGKELASVINSENRFSAVVDACISAVPSYTQAGMAALLPGNVLTLSPDGDEVTVDGKSSKGSANREQILSGECPAKVLDIRDALNKMDTTNLRITIRDYRTVYIYQNVIDERGESDLVSACSDAVRQLKDLVKKLGSSNVSNMFITSDHGFLFQNQDLTDCDFLSEGSVTGDKITKTTRRFVLGYGLHEVPGTVVCDVSSLGYGNDDGLQVAFPNSILRFRLSGADTHFVHGGLSLQEVVVPVIRITKGRSEDVSYVELQMLSKPGDITTGSISLKFYQSDYVSEKNRGYDAVFGIYSEDGTPVSNEIRKSIRSDSAEIRDREFQVEFSLNSDSNRYRGKHVYVTVKQVVDNGRLKDIIRVPVFLKRNSVFGELDF